MNVNRQIRDFISRVDEEGYNPDVDLSLLQIQQEVNESSNSNYCIECGDEIPMQRRSLKKCRCISCQELHEKYNKRKRIHGFSEYQYE